MRWPACWLTIGVPAGQIPAGLAARTELWRDRHGPYKQLLLVLDDAAGSEQVRPRCCPAQACGSLVLVTEVACANLTALEDAQTISLDTLPPGEAAGLLVRLAVRPGLSAADPGVREITRLCGCLPLAIGMLARQLYHHPAWTLAGRAFPSWPPPRVEPGAAGHPRNLSVAAAFDLSYADLAPDQQRLFRRVALHPGTDIDPYAAAALDRTGAGRPARSRPRWDCGRALPAHRGPGPGPVPDARLDPRARPRPRPAAWTPGDDREQATRRLLDYYQHAAARAQAPAGPPDPRRPRPGEAGAAAKPDVRSPGQPGAGAGVGPGRADQPADLPGPGHRRWAAHPGHRADRGPGGPAATRRPVGLEAITRHAAAVRSRPAARRPARRGPRPQQPRGRAATGRGLSRRGPEEPAGGAWASAGTSATGRARPSPSPASGTRDA